MFKKIISSSKKFNITVLSRYGDLSFTTLVTLLEQGENLGDLGGEDGVLFHLARQPGFLGLQGYEDLRLLKDYEAELGDVTAPLIELAKKGKIKRKHITKLEDMGITIGDVQAVINELHDEESRNGCGVEIVSTRWSKADWASYVDRILITQGLICFLDGALIGDHEIRVIAWVIHLKELMIQDLMQLIQKKVDFSMLGGIDGILFCLADAGSITVSDLIAVGNQFPDLVMDLPVMRMAEKGLLDEVGLQQLIDSDVIVCDLVLIADILIRKGIMDKLPDLDSVD